MSQHLQAQVRKVPLMAYVLVVLAIALLLSLSLLLLSSSSGAFHRGSAGSVTNGSMINPDGVTYQRHAGGVLASGVSIDGNGST